MKELTRQYRYPARLNGAQGLPFGTLQEGFNIGLGRLLVPHQREKDVIGIGGKDRLGSTWDDTVMLLSNGLRKTFGIDSVGKPVTIDGNGALGPVGGTNYSYNDNENAAGNRFAFLYGDPDMASSPVE